VEFRSIPDGVSSSDPTEQKIRSLIVGPAKLCDPRFRPPVGLVKRLHPAAAQGPVAGVGDKFHTPL